MTALRLQQSYGGNGSLVSRTTWAAAESLAAAFVANAPAIYVLVRQWRKRDSDVNERSVGFKEYNKADRTAAPSRASTKATPKVAAGGMVETWEEAV